MFTKVGFVLGCLVSVVSMHAQHTGFKCGTTEMHQQAVIRNPFLLERQEALERFTKEFSRAERTDETIIIPIVFHIIHDFGPENISDAQILDAVRILNEDFNRLNQDISDVVPEFADITANCGIEFRLAQKDPQGNCTNGIDRIHSLETYIGDDGAKKNSWLRDRYLNVWVVANMQNGVAGYAYYPLATMDFTLSQADGIMIRHNYVGSIGTSNEYNSRALTHEIGHYLNLQHPWGDTNDPGIVCGDDNVEDTPITEGSDLACNLSLSVCDPGVIENVQNFMDYSYCSKMFTEGQKLRMLAALHSPISGRDYLWSDEALAFTGVLQEPAALCAPRSDFYPERKFACVNEPIQFFANVGNGGATSWLWSFEGGSPATSDATNPTVSFNSTGWKTVSLSVANATGSDVRTVSQSVYISEGSNIYGPLSESFSSEVNLNGFWFARNLEGNESEWKWTTQAGKGGLGSLRLNASENETVALDDGDNDRDEIITPSMDLSMLDNGYLSFDLAVATRATDPMFISDKLELYSSKDCGETWTLRKAFNGLDLLTSGNVEAPFVPLQSQWRNFTWTIPSTLEDEGVRFKLVYTASSFSNDVWLDNVNIFGTVGMAEREANAFSVKVWPNPSSGEANIGLTMSAESESVSVRILDVTGKVVRSVYQGSLNRGEHLLPLNSQSLASGVYFLEVSSEKFKRVERWTLY